MREWCPAAQDYADDGATADRSVFDVGVVAHAMLEELHRESGRTGGAIIPAARAREIAAAVGAHCATVGRGFDGVPEPPVTPDAVGPAMALALDWLDHCGGQLDPATEAERTLAVDWDWRPCDYRDPDAMWRAVVDVVRVYEEEGVGPGIETVDYKSAWPTGPNELETVQIRGQSCLAHAHAERLGQPDPVLLTRSVVNLRTRRTYSETLDLERDGEILQRWRAEIRVLATAAPKRGPDGRRPHRPGPGCMSCPYRPICDAAPPEARDLQSTARRYAALQAEADALATLLREATREAPLRIDGRVLGYTTREEATVAPDAPRALLRLWTGEDDPPGAMVGLLSRILGVTGIRSAVTAIYRRRPAEQEAALATLLTTRRASRWGLMTDDKESP